MFNTRIRLFWSYTLISFHKYFNQIRETNVLQLLGFSNELHSGSQKGLKFEISTQSEWSFNGFWLRSRREDGPEESCGAERRCASSEPLQEVVLRGPWRARRDKHIYWQKHNMTELNYEMSAALETRLADLKYDCNKFLCQQCRDRGRRVDTTDLSLYVMQL